MDETEKRGPKINPAMAILLVFTALVFDGTQALLDLILIGIVLNWIVGFYAWLTFYVWLKNLHISMSDAKGMKTMITLMAAFGIEMVPLLNALPAWTAFVILTIMFDYATNVPIAGNVMKKAASLSKPIKV